MAALMLKVSNDVFIPDSEIEIHAVRSQGPGGQNVNKVASAVQLRFDIRASSLPEECKERLIQKRDHRITADGVIIIKAQQFRTQEKNRDDALRRLISLVRSAASPIKIRSATRPTVSSQKKRINRKIKRGEIKKLRRKIDDSVT
jgi:ribosome-associated protein